MKNFTKIFLTLVCLLGYMQVHAQSGNVYDNVPASVVWAFNSPSSIDAYTSEPENGFSLISFNNNGATVNGTGTRTHEEDPAVDINGNNVVFLKFKPVKGATDVLTWSVKPAKGLTFTPTRVSGWIQRFGTDSENGVTVTVTNAEGKSAKLGTYTALRANKGHNHKSYDANAVNKFDIELTPAQQAELASAGEISLSVSIGVSAGREGGFSDIHIEGLLNGTKEDVVKYALSVGQNLAEAGKVEVMPTAPEYEQGAEVKLSAIKNFGYAFVNWTDAAGKVVSTEPSFTYTVDAAAELTANFKALNTYELACTVEGGANAYQVQPSPAGTMVDGKLMYEEGTVVTLTASSNPLVTFSNWSDGSTFAENRMTMDGDKAITAVYSVIDYIVGWDFYLAGGSGRPADFASTVENEASALVLRDAEGNTSGWLDKSTVAAGGYESLAGAAVNWTKGASNGDVGHYYYQTKINARDFSNIRVSATMMYNFNAYTTQVLEYSLDGNVWKEAARISMTEVKTQYDITATLPAEADHAESLFLRWRPDTGSDVVGTPSENDGTAIANIYVIADADIYDDGTAPVLVSTVPADNADNASSTGRIVLNFDEKIKLTPAAKATLGGEPIELAVSGKTVTANYRNLTYATGYEFVLAGGSVCDAAGNTMTGAVKISFTTMSRPEIEKMAYDVEVSTADGFLAALAEANARQDAGSRYRIFLHNGTYDLGNRTLTPITGNNISLIGESQDGVVIVNKPEVEGIGVTATLFNTSTGLYMQDITLKNNYPYAQTTGRAVCLQDKGNKTVAKRVTLLSHQDTYYSNNSSSRFYWEDSEIHGDVDFLCGGGDVVYNRVNIVLEKRDGNVIAAPNGQLKYGYVFHDCEINCVAGAESVVNGKYRLGRPWGAECRAQYINTKMNVLPAADGWAEMGGNKPAVFAEYNSVDKNGSVVDLSSRKVKFDGGTQLSAKLTDAQVEELSIENVMGGSDAWSPLSLTEQAPAPSNVKLDGTVLSWDDSKYVSLWAVCKDGKVVAFTTEPVYDIEPEVGRAAAEYSVRAANEMGGLGEAVVASDKSAITDINADTEVVSTVYYNLQGIRVSANTPGVLVKVDTLASGKTVTSKVVL